MSDVLVIEDNKDNLKIVTYALERAGYRVIATETGEEGLRLAVAQRFAFILMDINLPGMDGIETTKQIRVSKGDGDLPIIAVTSYAMTGDRDRILAAGCNGYIEKPIDPLTIVEQIHKIVGLPGQVSEETLNCPLLDRGAVAAITRGKDRDAEGDPPPGEEQHAGDLQSVEPSGKGDSRQDSPRPV